MPVRPQIEADFKREPGFAVQRAGNQHGVLGGKDPAVLVRNVDAQHDLAVPRGPVGQLVDDRIGFRNDSKLIAHRYHLILEGEVTHLDVLGRLIFPRIAREMPHGQPRTPGKQQDAKQSEHAKIHEVPHLAGHVPTVPIGPGDPLSPSLPPLLPNRTEKGQ